MRAGFKYQKSKKRTETLLDMFPNWRGMIAFKSRTGIIGISDEPQIAERKP